MRFDFHTHSTASDGALSPEQLVRRAHQNGVRMLALTDHDQVAGLAAARQTATALGMTFINGVEISCTWRGMSVHIVGLHFNPEHPELLQGLAKNACGRAERALVMAQALEEVGIKNAYQRALTLAGGREDLLARTHFARVIVADKKAASVRHVFNDFLVAGKPGYVAHDWAEVSAAVAWIVAAQGVAVLAHPGRYAHPVHDPNSETQLLDEFIAAGGRAIEVVTGSHGKQQERHYAELAQQRGLWVSCGSDFHGKGESKMDVGKAIWHAGLGRPVYELWA